MRYTTVIISWETARLHPLDRAIAAAPEVQFEAVHYVNPVGDGTYVELTQFHGETATLVEQLEDASDVLDYKLSEDENGLVYVHFESTPLFDAFLKSIFEHTVVLRWPVQFVTESASRGVQITLMGPEGALSDALDALPDEIDVSLVRTGEYDKALAGPMQALSQKQRDLLNEALRAGYYEVPRETTQKELAETMGVTNATISNRLRRLESTLVKSATLHQTTRS